MIDSLGPRPARATSLARPGRLRKTARSPGSGCSLRWVMQSGLGREGGFEGIREHLEHCYTAVDR
ncbi:hypothetical protein [Pseudonocardia sp.]|uniref:hypothetical protein n=1 Tax=Pseudonocardia sp. TaxID=60912 RepID=UPI003D11F7FC